MRAPAALPRISQQLVVIRQLPPGGACRFVRPRLLSSSSSSSDNIDIDTRIYRASLEEVSTHGWTMDAIAAGIERENLPITMVGRLTPLGLVERFMEDCNQRFREQTLELDQDIQNRLVAALRARLEYVVPILPRWHEAMAMGALKQAPTTSRQVLELVQIVCDKVQEENIVMSRYHQAAIAAVYVATELHLLADTSSHHQDTWKFLEERVRDLDRIAQHGVTPSPESMVAASAVASSMVNAMVSLAHPYAQQAASSVVPSFLSLLRQQQPQHVSGSSPQDYSDLPPFPKK